MKFLDHLEEWIISFLMGAATLIVFFAVLHRYIAGLPIPGLQDALLKMNVSWAQELTIYMFVWMAKFGAAYGVRTGIHVGVDVLINQLSDKTRFKFIVFGLVSGAIFTGIVGTLASNFVWHISQTSQTSEVLEMPMWIVYMVLPLGTFLMCFRFLQVLVNFVRTGELPRHDHGHVDGIEDEENLVKPGEEARIYSMQDNLHPRDMRKGNDRRKQLGHPPNGEERRAGDERRKITSENGE